MEILKLKVKFSLRFRYGDVNWYNKDHWEKFTSDDIFKCLLSFTEIKDFSSVFNIKERAWIVTADVLPITSVSFEKSFRKALEEKYSKTDIDFNILEIKLMKGETKKFTTSIVMDKIKGGK